MKIDQNTGFMLLLHARATMLQAGTCVVASIPSFPPSCTRSASNPVLVLHRHREMLKCNRIGGVSFDKDRLCMLCTQLHIEVGCPLPDASQVLHVLVVCGSDNPASIQGLVHSIYDVLSIK